MNNVLFSDRVRQQDGDATDASSWTCSLAEACQITYDLGGVESLEQMRIGKSRVRDRSKPGRSAVPVELLLYRQVD